MRVPELENATLRDPRGIEPDLHVVSAKVERGRIQVFDDKTGVVRLIPRAEIYEKVGKGLLNTIRDGAIPRSSMLQRTDTDDTALLTAMAILTEIKETCREHDVSFNQGYWKWREAKLKKAADAGEDPPQMPARPTVYRWFGRDNKKLPLLLGDSCKGNRARRYSTKIDDLIVQQSEANYLVKKSRWTLSKLTENINLLATDQGLLLTAQKISPEYVRAVIYRHSTADEDGARMDPKDAIAAKAVAKHQIRVGSPLQRVEQDALHLPFVAMTKWGPTSNIWWVHAIDCFGSWPVGWKLVIGAPTSSASFKCLELVMFPLKQTILESMGIECALQLYGTPMQLIFDNGPENKGDRMPRLTRLQIKPMHCKARHAHGKPFIERLNRSLKDALETLPGCTRVNGVDGKRDPIAEGDELMDIEELEKWIVSWYFKQWVNTGLKRLKSRVFRDEFVGQTPSQVMKHITEEEYALPLPPNLDEWKLIQYEQNDLVLSRKTGVTLKGFQFKGDNLERLIRIFGEVRIRVLSDPDDFRFVWVPVGLEIDAMLVLQNADVDETTPAYSYAQAQEMLKSLPPDLEGEKKREAFRREVYGRSAMKPATDAPAKKTTRPMSQETTQRAREAAAVARAAARPVDEARRNATAPSPAPSRAPPQDQPAPSGANPFASMRQGTLFETQEMQGTRQP
jgi:putative transposase